MNIKRVVLSLAMIVFVGGLVASGTGAFFSDTETSEENIFTAGAVDLKVDSVAHINGLVCFDSEWIDEDLTEWDGAGDPPSLVLKADVDQADIEAAELAYNTDFPANFPKAGDDCEGTWTLTDLGLNDDTQVPSTKFFNYTDLKPGDHGENTISLHVINNDAYMCAIINNMKDTEVGDDCTEPESEDEDTTCDPNADDEGEISQFLKFFTWADDGDNIWEEDEQVLFSNESGPASDVIDGRVYPLFVPGTTGPIAAETTEYIGMYWCFGDINVDYDDYTLECDGEPVDNTPQTDMLTADIGFYVEQARNNPNFECTDELLRDEDDDDPVLPEADVVTATGWSPVDLDDTNGASNNISGGAEKSEWFAKARNNNGGFEIQVGTDDDTGTGYSSADAVWAAGVPETFTLSYDGLGNATLSIVGETPVTFAVGAVGTLARIGVNVKAPTGDTTLVDNLVLDIAAPLSDDDVDVTGGTNHMLITGVDLDQAWELTGTFEFSAVGGPSDENPAVQFSID